LVPSCAFFDFLCSNGGAYNTNGISDSGSFLDSSTNLVALYLLPTLFPFEVLLTSEMLGEIFSESDLSSRFTFFFVCFALGLPSKVV